MPKLILRSPGMSVPEVLFALVLLTVTFLSLMAVLASGLRADKKGFVKQSAAGVAELLSARLVASLQEETARNNFWANEHPDRSAPYSDPEASETVGDTVFQYEICTTYLRQPDGTVFNPGHRLMQVDIYVRWGSDDTRSGFGSALYHDQLVLSEVAYGAEDNP